MSDELKPPTLPDTQEKPIKKLYMGVIDKEALDGFIDKCVQNTIAAKGNGGNELILLSGGSASNVGYCTTLLSELKITNPKTTMQIDSEAVLAANIIPDMNKIERMGYKHAEKFPRYINAFREVLKYATEMYYYKLAEYNQQHGTNIKGTVVVDDHFENFETARSLAETAKKYESRVGYIGVYVDPRVALHRAAQRSSDGKDVVAPAFQIGTYRGLPDAWKTVCDSRELFDAAILVHNNREMSQLPHVIARRIGDKEMEVTNPLEFFCFEAIRRIKNGARKVAEIFGDANLEKEFIEQNQQPDGSLAQTLFDNNKVQSFVERLRRFDSQVETNSPRLD